MRDLKDLNESPRKNQSWPSLYRVRLRVQRPPESPPIQDMLHGTEPEDGFFAEANPAYFWAMVGHDWDCFFCKVPKAGRGRVVDVSCELWPIMARSFNSCSAGLGWWKCIW